MTFPTEPMPRTLFALFFSCLALLLPACTETPAAAGMHYIVSAPQTGFYKYGPAQSMGADFMLQHGARLTMLKNSFGFAHVTTDDGTAGYVATDDIEPAPMITTARTGPGSSNGGQPPAGRYYKPTRPLPLTGSPLFESDLPQPENPPPSKSSSPNFRF